MQTKRERNLLSWGIIFGTLTGAIAAYLLAPQSGDKTKRTLAKKLNNFTQTSIIRTQNALLHFEDALEKSMAKDEMRKRR